MTQRTKAGDRQIRAFEAALTKILGPDNFPREAIGDLSDLLDTLRRGVSSLTELMNLRGGFEREAATKLLELELLVGDDLRMIAKDLLPALRKMRKAAYSGREDKVGEVEGSEKPSRKAGQSQQNANERLTKSTASAKKRAPSTPGR